MCGTSTPGENMSVLAVYNRYLILNVDTDLIV